jgi:beta-lactamase regulating signal transducer with metallopeptidase domain
MILGILENPAMLRMGWALLHFLWQGTLLALALKGALALIEHRFSRLRYGLAAACLFLMAALPVFLLCKPQKGNAEVPAAYGNMQFEAIPASGSSSAPIPVERKPDFSAIASQFLTPLVPWIAAGWFAGMALLLLKTLGGVVQVRVFMQRTAAHCETKVMKSSHRLAARARIAGIPILESQFVTVPTVAGWFKPVVLLPKGAAEKFDRSLLEALIAHEFAHIRRHDIFINLVQNIVESMLFFHPAMWWVTRSVRAEREACCDDEAVKTCGDTLVYVRALSQAEQFRSSLPVLALSSSPLLHRIRRLTDMQIARTNHIFTFCGALLSVLFIIGAATGSILLTTIPQVVSASTQSADQNSGKAEPAARAISDPRYNLLCGIVIVNPKDFAGKRWTPSPPSKDDKDRVGACMLFDESGPKPAKVYGSLQESKLIHKVNPVYPESAISKHIGIRVLLRINLNEEGLVTDAEVAKCQTVPPDRDSNGNWVGGVPAGVVKGINSAAINAVKQWKYSPTLLNGKAIAVRTSVSITFTFSKDGAPQIFTFIG